MLTSVILIPAMNLVSLLSLVGLVAVSLAARLEPAPLSDAEINYINSIDGLTWKVRCLSNIYLVRLDSI